MSSSFRKTSSNIFLSAFVALILVSFMFTGNEYLMGTSDQVANVGGEAIRYNEYENELNRQMQFYKQFFGGQELTQKQIEQYNLKNNAVNNLVARKLMGFVANEIGAGPSLEEIKQDIKNQPYFQTNEQFDISRYKAVLARVGMTPEDFEKETQERLQLQIAQDVFSTVPISQGYLDEVEKIKSNKRIVQYISFKKDSLRNHIPVSKSEIDAYLKDEANLNRIQDLFNSRKAALSTPDQVHAAHILLKTDGTNDEKVKNEIMGIHQKLTAKNFAEMANKFSQDGNMDPETKKKKGGDLGWFSKGRMVPEFEKAAFSTPVGQVSAPFKTQFGYHIVLIKEKKDAVEAKFDDHKDAIAKQEILTTKLSEIDKLSDELAKNIDSALGEKSIKKVTALKDKFQFTFAENKEVNPLDGLGEEQKLDESQLRELFEQPVGKTHTFKSPSQVTIVRVDPFVEQAKKAKVENKAEGESEETPELNEKDELEKMLSRKLSQNMINNMRENTSIKIYSNRL